MVGYDDYILFVLGVNNNALSCLIRSHLRSTDDMYGMYQKCQRIAEEFSIYDGNRPNYERECHREDVENALKDLGIDNISPYDIDVMVTQYERNLAFDDAWYDIVRNVVHDYLEDEYD